MIFDGVAGDACSAVACATSGMYGHLDANVVNNDPSCFRGCPQPTNVTSDCYLQCYTKATERMSKDELAAPWDTAFAKTDRAQGGCPTVGGTL